MKIKKSVLTRIVVEEYKRILREDKEEKKAAQEEAPKDEKGPQKKDKKPPAPKKDKPEPEKTDASQVPEELPAEEEPADKELDKADEPDEDAEDVTGGEISKEVVGKSVQSITMEPKSKIMPGAQEIVITFDQIPDPLRILINKSGVVKFFLRGLHNQV